MVIMAIVLGIAGFLIISFMLNRPSAPADEFPVVVDDTEVLVRLNANKTVEIIGPGAVNPEQPALQPAQDSNLPTPVTEPPPEPLPTLPPVLPTAVPTLPPPPTSVPVVEKVILIDFVVPGDASLYGVSSRIDTSIALMSQYGLSATDLVPGTTIRLPIGNPNYCPGQRTYAVGEGDTAFSIGQKFGISAEQLQSINNLDQNFTVRVADIICVP